MLRFVCVVLLAVLVAGQENEEYRQRRTRGGRFGPIRGIPATFNDGPPAESSEPTKPPPKPIAIIKQISENKGDGTYTFSYETENGIIAEETGRLDPGGEEGIQRVKGAFSYLGPDNIRYTVTYTADENGFQAKGDHLPTSPPIPAEILKALEENAAEEAAAAAAAASGGNAGNIPPGFFQQF